VSKPLESSRLATAPPIAPTPITPTGNAASPIANPCSQSASTAQDRFQSSLMAACNEGRRRYWHIESGR
jgi:hypothetical protein